VEDIVKYILLIHAASESAPSSSPEFLITDVGCEAHVARLRVSLAGTELSSLDGAHLRTDGPFIETKEHLLGPSRSAAVSASSLSGATGLPRIQSQPVVEIPTAGPS